MAEYNGQLLPESPSKVTLEQQLALLDWHPVFTGRCPECEMPIRSKELPRAHWACEDCNWSDDSL